MFWYGFATGVAACILFFFALGVLFACWLFRDEPTLEDAVAKGPPKG